MRVVLHSRQHCGIQPLVERALVLQEDFTLMDAKVAANFESSGEHDSIEVLLRTAFEFDALCVELGDVLGGDADLALADQLERAHIQQRWPMRHDHIRHDLNRVMHLCEIQATAPCRERS